MKFAYPYLLNLLWVLVPVFGIISYGMHQRHKIIQAFITDDMQKLVAPGYFRKQRWKKTALIMLSSGFAITALAGPLAGFRWEKIEQKGVDIMIGLDCSKSMLAKDIAPDRLSRAKREIIDLLRMMKSDRAGLVAFSGSAILQCPLTLDRDAFHIFLDVLTPGYLPVGGTDIDAAIRACEQGFEKDSNTEKAIILITDGENTSGDVEQIAKEMAEKGIKIFCIGVGDMAGAPIPDKQGGFVKDRSGNIVLSKVDEKGLEKIAALTGGTYVRSVAGDMDLDLIYVDKIQKNMEKRALTSDKKKVWENRFQWVLLPSVFLLFIEIMLSSGKRTTRLPVLVFFSFVLSLMSFQPHAMAKMVFSSVKDGINAYEIGEYETAKTHFIDAQLDAPDNEIHYFNIGTAAYMNDELEQALKNFSQAAESRDEKLKHHALYNLANTHYKMGNLDQAIQGYETVLQSFPHDQQAKENLAFVKKKKEEQKQQQQNDSDKTKDQGRNRDQGKSQEESAQSQQSDKAPSSQETKDNKAQENNKGDQQSQPSDMDDKPDQDGDTSRPRKNQTEKKPAAGQKEKSKTNGSDPENQPGSTGNGQGQPHPSRQQMDQMLNRLEDKPGRAMRPIINKKKSDKDW